ncbi:co-chaperone DjlA [Aliikangiella sp. IMCC44359]|uniref:co-chaperone DjlA n=1 Tax=Aliikangiella sp. IMCC44359 TaxID=3459125 RepID=UPI00403AE8B6
MKIFGKIICGTLGFIVGGPIGLLLGIWIGHSFDKGFNQDFGNFFEDKDPSKTQAAFFESTFAVMGHIAKADGVVKKAEIDAAEQVMLKLGLTGEKRAKAIKAFNSGKSIGFDLNAQLQGLITNCARKPSLIQMFLEIQILGATADGNISHTEMQILYQIGGAFKIPTSQIDRLVEMVIAQQSFYQSGASGGSAQANAPSIEQAYKVLGIDTSATEQEIKRAYRKLMSQHHPDKLVAKGMPEEMVKMATEKSQEIQSAYEMIKKQKGVN